MSTKETEQHTEKHPKILSRGKAQRDARHLELAKANGWDKRTGVGVDNDIIEQFEQLTGEGQSAALINQALREWLEARSIQELLRAQLPKLVQEAFSNSKQNQQAPAQESDAA